MHKGVPGNLGELTPSDSKNTPREVGTRDKSSTWPRLMTLKDAEKRIRGL